MKFIKILTILFFIGLLLQIFAHFNLMVSYKYEVDHMKSFIKPPAEMSEQDKIIRLKKIDERKEEIEMQQLQTIVLFWFFLIGLIVLMYLRYRSKAQTLNLNK